MLIEKSLTGFMDELASSSPAPGGGSAAALAGGVGASLVIMVCNLTCGKPKFEEVWSELEKVREEATWLQQRLSQLIDLDTQSFNLVMQAFKMPKETDEDKQARSAAIQAATIKAAEIPLEVAQCCLDVLALTPVLAQKGNENAASDIGVAAQQAEAGMQGAILNVKINLGSIKDQDFVAMSKEQIEKLLVRGEKLKTETLAVVESKL